MPCNGVVENVDPSGFQVFQLPGHIIYFSKSQFSPLCKMEITIVHISETAGGVK